MKYLFSLILLFSSCALFSQGLDRSNTVITDNGLNQLNSSLEELGDALGDAWNAVVECFTTEDTNSVYSNSNYVAGLAPTSPIKVSPKTKIKCKVYKDDDAKYDNSPSSTIFIVPGLGPSGN